MKICLIKCQFEASKGRLDFLEFKYTYFFLVSVTTAAACWSNLDENLLDHHVFLHLQNSIPPEITASAHLLKILKVTLQTQFFSSNRIFKAYQMFEIDFVILSGLIT